MYRAPVEEISFTLKKVAGLGELSGFDEELADAVLEEAGRFASERIAPLNAAGDLHGAPMVDGKITLTPGWKEAYADWRAAGWGALSASPEHGGQGLPAMMSVAASEMWNGASMAWALNPLLTSAAILALERHGSEEVNSLFLEKMVSGEWTGTMNLTESHAGTDLAALKTRAEPVGDGRYRIFGQKIFITYGDHDMTENICHLVLARIKGAPSGTKGISLFLVPKFLPDENGSVGERNDVVCQSAERKLGIHASPTCVMLYGDGRHGDSPGAIGWLVGEENKGLNCMFTMMNQARLAVGIQGVAIGEAAFQHALAYAHERRQGKSESHKGEGMSPIVEHPDVARNLLTMKAMVQAARSVCYSCAQAIDLSRAAAREGEADEAKAWSERAGLLTPVAKAFSSDAGVEVASIGVQVHGGMGFIEETGAAQFLRDARINPIYEGTNGVQAIDLVTRKLGLSNGEAISSYVRELRSIAESVRGANHESFGNTAEALDSALDSLDSATSWLLERLGAGETKEALAGATPYLRLFGLAAGGAYLARAGLAEQERAGIARFFAENFLPECDALRKRVVEGAESLEAARVLLDG